MKDGQGMPINHASHHNTRPMKEDIRKELLLSVGVALHFRVQ